LRRNLFIANLNTAGLKSVGFFGTLFINMKIILKDNVPHLGQKDDVKEAKPGFWRNFLLPRGLAVEATPQLIKQANKRKEEIERREKEQEEKLLELLGGLKDKVLEIGTGSGYNAALISKLCKFIYTTEYFEELAEFADKNIKKLGIKNIKIIHADGSKGYEKEAPYDKIIATAACPQIPKPWIEQLKEKGIIVAPVGPWHGQDMLKIKKVKGKLKQENLGQFMFVPLKGKYGF